MKKITFFLILIMLNGCTLRSHTTTSTTPGAEVTSYNMQNGTTEVIRPVSVTKTTETTSLH